MAQPGRLTAACINISKKDKKDPKRTFVVTTLVIRFLKL